MFDFVRKHTKVMMFIMFLLIIPAFVLVGIDGFKQSGGTGETVATVAGHKITQNEWDFAHRNEVDRLRATMPNLDVKMLDSPEARYVTLERLVRDRVMTEAARESRLVTTDARLARELQQNPTIASLRSPDGKLDMERYRQLTASQGLSPDGFELRVRNDLSARQVEAGIASTAFSSKAMTELSLNAFFERREVQITRFNAADYASKVAPSEDDIQAFYKANPVFFQAPESASVEYVVLDMEGVKKSITLSEADVKAYYDQNAARLSGKEERRASHILISAAKNAPESNRQKARALADSLLLQVRKSPESFADVARKNSQDPGSAPNGGDLNLFGRGAMVKPFEDAAFALKKGEISDVVESDFGFHIIRLTDIKAPKQRSFEELRPSIEADLKAQQAQSKFAEAAEAFTNAVYEQSDTFKPIAERLKLDVKTQTNLQRAAQPGGVGALASPKLLAALFSADAIDKKRNTEAVEVGPNQLAAARIIQYTPPRTLPLADVRAGVRDRLVASRSAEMAKKEGAGKLVAWKAAAPTGLPAAVVVSRDRGQPIQGPILDAVLRVDPESLPAWIGVDLDTQGYAVVRINQVLPRTPPAPNAVEQERKQLGQWVANAENQAFYQAIKRRFKVQIKIPRPSKTLLGANVDS